MSSVYVVTGASRGIGLEFVRQIASRKDQSIVFACARDPSSSQDLQSIIIGSNRRVFAIKLDITDQASIKGATEEIAKHSPKGIDILINNAGIGCTPKYNIETTPRDEYLKVFDTNVFGVSLVTQAMIPLLRQLGQDKLKRIVNISSVLGSITAMDGTRGSRQGPAYSVAKAALNMMTRLTANELRSENFIVFAIHPGWVKTDLGGEHAPVTQEESVQGILDKLHHADANDSGGFFDYTGKELNW